jgi:hypothetical protein
VERGEGSQADRVADSMQRQVATALDRLGRSSNNQSSLSSSSQALISEMADTWKLCGTPTLAGCMLRSSQSNPVPVTFLARPFFCSPIYRTTFGESYAPATVAHQHQLQHARRRPHPAHRVRAPPPLDLGRVVGRHRRRIHKRCDPHAGPGQLPAQGEEAGTSQCLGLHGVDWNRVAERWR